MSETSKKIDDASFSEVKMLQGKFQELIFKMGKLQVDKIKYGPSRHEFCRK